MTREELKANLEAIESSVTVNNTYAVKVAGKWVETNRETFEKVDRFYCFLSRLFRK